MNVADSRCSEVRICFVCSKTGLLWDKRKRLFTKAWKLTKKLLLLWNRKIVLRCLASSENRISHLVPLNRDETNTFVSCRTLTVVLCSMRWAKSSRYGQFRGKERIKRWLLAWKFFVRKVSWWKITSIKNFSVSLWKVAFWMLFHLKKWPRDPVTLWERIVFRIYCCFWWSKPMQKVSNVRCTVLPNLWI